MATVIIDGVEYVPKAEVPPITDGRLKLALQYLTDIQYFHECTNKHRAWAWDAMRFLAPDIAELSASDPKAAYDLVHNAQVSRGETNHD